MLRLVITRSSKNIIVITIVPVIVMVIVIVIMLSPPATWNPKLTDLETPTTRKLWVWAYRTWSPGLRV